MEDKKVEYVIKDCYPIHSTVVLRSNDTNTGVVVGILFRDSDSEVEPKTLLYEVLWDNYETGFYPHSYLVLKEPKKRKFGF